MIRNPFRELLGARGIRTEKGRALVGMSANELLTNSHGVIHGGAICTLSDVAIGTAIRSALNPGDLISTIELKVNFISPGQGDLVADARAAHVGKSTAVGDVEVRDREGALVAKGMGTFSVRRGVGPVRPGARTAMIPEYDGPEPEE